MLMMGDGTMASRVEAQVRLMLRACAKDEEAADRMNDVQLPDQTTYRRWRYGMGHLCMVQIGMLLTQAAHEDKNQACHQHRLVTSRDPNLVPNLYRNLSAT